VTERIPCNVAGCARQILPATGRDTGGMCMPCYQGWGLPNRKPPKRIDRFEGLRDPVDILVRHFDPPRADGNIYLDAPEPPHAYCERLTPTQQERLRDEAIALLARGGRCEQSMAVAVATQTRVDLRPLQLALLARDALVAPAAFASADADVRDALFARLQVEDRRELWAALEALAWCGDDVVVEHFAQWRSRPPAWWQRFDGALADVTHVAGWELDERGRRRELVAKTCIELVARAAGQPVSESDQVRVAVRTEATCSSCGAPVCDLLRVREPAGVLAVPFCANCLYEVGPQRGSYDDAGRSALATLAGGADGCGDHEAIPEDALRAGRSRPARWALEWGAAPASQLGGFPTWIQGPGYPGCPSCQRTMRFVGQLDTEDLELGMEGFHYAFACRGCRTTAAVFQCS